MEINGKEIAKKLINNLKSQPKPDKILAAVTIGENPVSMNFLEQKKKIAEELGIDFRIYKPEHRAHKTLCASVLGRAHTEGMCSGSSNDDLRKEIEKIALLKRVGGVIIQLPLPEHLNRQYILNVIPREKDVDVLGERALGAFYAGRNPILPPAVGTLNEILKTKGYDLKTNKVAVVGLGFLVGKPIANWLMAKCSEVFLLDIGSDLSILKQADLVISGVGKAGLIKPEMLKEGAGVIDFGYSINETGKISGDFDALSLVIGHSSSLSFFTPTPGGTGPILVAKIFENFYKLNNAQ